MVSEMLNLLSTKPCGLVSIEVDHGDRATVSAEDLGHQLALITWAGHQAEAER